MPLLPKELAILELLVDMKGKLASHKMLLGAVWANQEISDDSLTR